MFLIILFTDLTWLQNSLERNFEETKMLESKPSLQFHCLMH